ncbi:MAG: hypothetical protein AB7S48_11870 [Bacteroidales bacterium]
MTHKLASVLSVIFHPFLVTLYSFLLIFSSGSYISFLPSSIKLVIMMVVLLNTFLIPIISLVIIKRLGLIKSFYLEKHRERIIPIVITSIPYFFTLYLLAKLPVPHILVRIIESGIIILLVAAIVSYWWKISLHLMGIGGLTGFLFACTYNNYFNAIPFIVIALMVSGLLASARLSNGDHKPSQVYLGFFTGVCIVFSFFLL